ncbi:hypothetical protein BKH18_07330 [Actinomyces oris]|uniref:hypothetical protein n=1 Tax=Actinomyces oris TaxID=544580 RepID=UPI00094CD8C4|nr:hypothetical protein [Actinomyces oris]OLO76285.1 hypothetical protein BKH18_07330 [Actinomyces oris]
MPRATDVDYPIDGSPSASGYSADQADAALNRRRRRHQRIITALTSLRFGCFLGMVAAAALCVICGSGIAKVLLKLPLLSWKGLALTVFLWACGVVLWPESRHDSRSTRNRVLTAARSALMLLPAVLVPAAAVYAVLPIVSLWRFVFSTYAVNLGEALAYSMGVTAFALLLSTDILLRASRALFEPYAEKSLYEPNPISARIHDLRDQLRRPWRSSLQTLGPRALLALVPVVALVASVAVPYRGHPTASARPTITQATGPSMNADQLPAYPTGFASQETWTKNLERGQNVIAGAAGPIILTSDGATGLDPRDGSNRWSYQRKGSTVGKVIRSPDGHYLAMRFDDPVVYTSLTNTDGELDSSTPKATVVLDTITGATVFDWRGDSPLQLTDSAVLYGTTAYSLKDRSTMWDLRKLTVDGASGAESAQAAYFGAAGHSAFVLSLPSGDHDVVVSQKDPTTSHELPDLTPQSSSPTTGGSDVGDSPVVIDGWVVIDKPGGKQVKPAWSEKGLQDSEVQAVSLDGLAGVPGADTRAYDLGVTSKVNSVASRKSQTLVTLPPLPAEKPENDVDSDLLLWEASGTVGSVFNPRTLAVTTASQTPGLAAASVGITQAAVGEAVEGRITIKPADGSSGASIPLAPGTTFAPPGDKLYNPQLKDLALANVRPEENLVSAISTPGATIIMVQTGTRYSGTSRIYAVGGEAR